MLCGLNSLTGASIAATDGAMGTAGDFLFDDRTGAIHYLVLETLETDNPDAELTTRERENLHWIAQGNTAILDWRMQGMTGEQLFDRLIAIRPGIKVIVASGDNPSEVESAFAGRRVVGFLPKPFKVEALVTAVKILLAA